MEAIRRQIGKIWLLRQALFSLAMAGLILVCVAFQYHPRTPYGTQCPTAPVQAVEVPIECCGAVVGFEYRQPAPGDAVFMQCHCAEKKADGHQASLPPKLDVLITPIVVVAPKAFVLPRLQPPVLVPSDFDWYTPPPVPPPNAA